MDNILWYESLNIVREGKSTHCCLALRADTLLLLDADSGAKLWSFDDKQTQWGNSVRGCPSSFQPDRCVLIQDINNNGCQEIVLAHPHRPELLCLDGQEGAELWRAQLLDAANIQTAGASSLCPIVLQAFDHEVGAELCAVVAPHDPTLAATNRWLMSVDPVLGKVLWKLASQQSLAKPTKTTVAAMRPLHLQWGEVEKRPIEFGYRTTYNYFDDYWAYIPNGGMRNPYENNVRLGTDRPFKLSVGGNTTWYWIDGQDWHKVDSQSGKLVNTRKLPADCVAAPHLLRVPDGRTLALTVHANVRSGTEFTAWDGIADEPVWQHTFECDLDRLPQSFLSGQSDFPLVADLNGDGCDEWFAPTYVPGRRWSHPMTPPYGMVMLHRSIDGQAIWNEPFFLPSMDGMIERAVVVSDQDRDGWKDLLLGSRFQGGGVRGGVACFVDLVSGQTGKRIWHSQVRTESNRITLGPNELVDLTVLEEQHLIAVVTHSGMKSYNAESPRPYSTTFLNLDSGEEETFGLGVRATSFGVNTWLEHRLPSELGQRASRSRTGQLVGWAYPALKEESTDSLTLWSTEDYACSLYADLDHDGFPEVIGSRNSIGYCDYALLNGLTGKSSWSKRVATQKDAPYRSVFWNELQQDVNQDGIDDLSVLISDADYGSSGLPKEQLQFATFEIVCGASGRTIWQHSATERGVVNQLAFFKRDLGRLPLLIYQHDRSNKVTCVDLGSRKIAWESHSFNAKLQPQSFETWIHDGAIAWFSTNETEQGNATFVNAETGEVILQRPIGQRPAVPWTTWIKWQDRELLPIQTITQIEAPKADEPPTYQTDLWLIDRSVTLAGHWSETTSVAASAVAANWFQKSYYDMPFPKVVKTPGDHERLAIPTVTDGSIGYRLLGWDDAEPKQLVVDRTVRLPIDPSSTNAFVISLDCDGDRYTDFVSLSDSGIDCVSASGDALWHRPAIATARLCGAIEKEGKGYLTLQTEPTTANSVFYVDARTGEKCDVSFDAVPLNNALNANDPEHLSLIALGDTSSKYTVASSRRKGVRIRSRTTSSEDPRYVRLLPWVVNAKFFLLSNPVTITKSGVSAARLVKLVFGVFIIPVVVVWICSRSRFTIRQLLVVSSTIALTLSLVLADRSDFPTDDRQLGYGRALEAAFFLAFHAFILLLPLMELTRTRWRRTLSISVYVAMLLIVALVSLVAYPASPIRTTYTYQEFWHLFWFAVLPTGIVLLVIHGLRLVAKGLIRIGVGKNILRHWRAKHVLAKGKESVGDLHGG